MTYDLRPGGRVVDLTCFYVGRFFNIVITRVSSLTILLLYLIILQAQFSLIHASTRIAVALKSNNHSCCSMQQQQLLRLYLTAMVLVVLRA